MLMFPKDKDRQEAKPSRHVSPGAEAAREILSQHWSGVVPVPLVELCSACGVTLVEAVNADWTDDLKMLALTSHGSCYIMIEPNARVGDVFPPETRELIAAGLAAHVLDLLDDDGVFMVTAKDTHLPVEMESFVAALLIPEDAAAHIANTRGQGLCALARVFGVRESTVSQNFQATPANSD